MIPAPNNSPVPAASLSNAAPVASAPTAASSPSPSVRLPEVIRADEVVTELLEKHRASNFHKLNYMGDWYLNLAFYQGKQWTVWDRGTLSVRDVQNPLNEVRHVSNKIRPICRDIVALMQSADPYIEVVPASGELEDQQYAQTTQTLLDYAKRVVNWDTLKRDRDWIRCVFGTAFLRFWMDPEAGETLQLPLRNPQTGAMDQVQIQEGEIRAEVYNPFDVHVFPVNASSPRHIVSVMFTSYRPIEELREEYPEYAAEIRECDDLNAEEFHRRKIEWLNSPTAVDQKNGKVKGMARVFEYIEAPTRKNPDGRKVVIVNKTMVKYGPNPFARLFPLQAPNYLKLGVIVYRGIDVPNRIWGAGIPEDLRPMQVRHNRAITDFERNRLALGRNKVLMPKGSGITEDQLNNAHAAVIEYNPGIGQAPIQILPAAPLPNQIFGEIAENNRDMDDASGRPEVSRGMNPTQVRSASHAEFLGDNANAKFGLIARETELGDADAARVILAMIKRYYSNLKILRVCGQNKGFAPFLAQIGNIYTDVHVVPGSALPKNRSAWNNMLATLWQMGALVDDGGRPDIKFLKQNLDLGGYRYESPDQADIDRQDTEIVALSQGQWVDPKPFDNHIIHIERIDAYLKRHHALNPMIEQMLLMHQQSHFMAMVMGMAPAAPVTNPAMMQAMPQMLMSQQQLAAQQQQQDQEVGDDSQETGDESE